MGTIVHREIIKFYFIKFKCPQAHLLYKDFVLVNWMLQDIVNDENVADLLEADKMSPDLGNTNSFLPENDLHLQFENNENLH